MIKGLHYSILFAVLSSAIADSSTQTDWSGGSGVWGPVSSFNDQYYYGNSIDCSVSGSVRLAPAVIFHLADSLYNGANCARFVDIDGDGYVDILGSAMYGTVTWWKNVDGSGTELAAYPVSSYSGFSSAHTNDMDMDGDLDVIACSWYAKKVCWWENLDGAGVLWTLHNIDSNYISAQSARSADIDGDGDPDVIASSFFNDACNWWENTDGHGETWVKHTVPGYAHGIRTVNPVDIDGDGDIDIIGALQPEDAIVWWENTTGTGYSWVQHGITGSFQEPWDVYPEDIDGDGDMDVIAAGHAVCWWENLNGSGTDWFEHVVVEDYTGATVIDTEDFDSDNDMDILVNSQGGSGSISWWENIDGEGNSWIGHYITSAISSFVSAGDINSDGDIDIAGTSYQNDIIAWCDLSAFSDGILESSCLYLQNDPGWGELNWISLEPSGTDVSFQVRSADSPDPQDMGPWSDTLNTPCSLAGLLDESDSYFQYRAILQSATPDETPSLNEVTVSWESLGINDGDVESEEEPTLLANPCDRPEISFQLINQESVEISVFDLAGRCIVQRSLTEYAAGKHSIVLDDMNSGMFLICIKIGSSEFVKPLIVIH